MREFFKSRKEMTESFCRWLAFKLPRRLVMWAAIRVIVNATSGKFSNQIVPELSAMDAIKRWEE